MQIDHIFIFTDTPHILAEELVAFGLTEGSSRIHPGQGTTNRKFYFKNFFLEILWVHDESEITSPTLLPIGLWKRAKHADNHTSPYGLCLVNTPDVDAVFATATTYQPTYFPDGLAIEVIAHEFNPSLPWTFRLPFRGAAKPTLEPTSHSAGLQQLTCATFGLTHYNANDTWLQKLTDQPELQFVSAPVNNLLLTFDNNRQGLTKSFEAAGLTIAY